MGRYEEKEGRNSPQLYQYSDPGSHPRITLHIQMVLALDITKIYLMFNVPSR